MKQGSGVGAVLVREWLPLLTAASIEVFEMMLSVQLQRGEQAAIPIPECTAIVGLTGSLMGSSSLRCGTGTATQMAALMLKLPVERALHYGADALGEIANMIAGDFKNRINGLSDRCLLSTPTIVIGMDYQCHALDGLERRDLWFRLDNQPVQITLEVQV